MRAGRPHSCLPTLWAIVPRFCVAFSVDRIYSNLRRRQSLFLSFFSLIFYSVAPKFSPNSFGNRPSVCLSVRVVCSSLFSSMGNSCVPGDPCADWLPTDLGLINEHLRSTCLCPTAELPASASLICGRTKKTRNPRFTFTARTGTGTAAIFTPTFWGPADTYLSTAHTVYSKRKSFVHNIFIRIPSRMKWVCRRHVSSTCPEGCNTTHTVAVLHIREWPKSTISLSASPFHGQREHHQTWQQDYNFAYLHPRFVTDVGQLSVQQHFSALRHVPCIVNPCLHPAKNRSLGAQIAHSSLFPNPPSMWVKHLDSFTSPLSLSTTHSVSLL